MSSLQFTERYLVGATALVVVLQVLAVHTPFLQSILRTVPLSLMEWLMVVPVAASIVLVEEIRKWLYRRKAAQKAARTVHAYAS